MTISPGRWNWLTVPGFLIAAVVLRQQADAGQQLVGGLPAWILIAIALQALLTVVAAAMARR